MGSYRPRFITLYICCDFSMDGINQIQSGRSGDRLSDKTTLK